MELSVVIPCLNEEETIGKCLDKASSTLEKNQVSYEIIVADNGSTDNSIKISKTFPKVRVIRVEKKGYGSALKKGIEHADGKFILMADADDSYDFNDIMKFLNKTRSGYKLVQGCRFPSGGGEIKEGAMPISHKIFGNPFLTKIARSIYKIPFNDIYCGMRCFEKKSYLKNNYFSEGMTFAVENLIKLFNSGIKCTEVPITLYKDGRVKNRSHLKTISDGFKTLKLLLICSPKWIYFYPSLILLLYSLFGLYSFINENYNIQNLDNLKFLELIKINFLLIISIQIFSVGIFTSIIAYQTGFQEKSKIKTILKFINLKKFLNFTLIFSIFFSLFLFKFLNISEELKIYVFYNYFCIVGMVIFNSFFCSLLEMTFKDENKG